MMYVAGPLLFLALTSCLPTISIHFTHTRARARTSIHTQTHTLSRAHTHTHTHALALGALHGEPYHKHHCWCFGSICRVGHTVAKRIDSSCGSADSHHELCGLCGSERRHRVRGTHALKLTENRHSCARNELMFWSQHPCTSLHDTRNTGVQFAHVCVCSS